MSEAIKQSSSAEPMILMQGVHKWYGQFHVLKDINLSVQAGERLFHVLENSHQSFLFPIVSCPIVVQEVCGTDTGPASLSAETPSAEGRMTRFARSCLAIAQRHSAVSETGSTRTRCSMMASAMNVASSVWPTTECAWVARFAPTTRTANRPAAIARKTGNRGVIRSVLK